MICFLEPVKFSRRLLRISRMGVYVSANNANRAQKNADTTIIDKYGEDVNFINEIYKYL
mgnify:CR=1 FL=1